jgi:hypothetical protein
MNAIPWTQVLTEALAAFFLMGFVINTFAVVGRGKHVQGLSELPSCRRPLSS